MQDLKTLRATIPWTVVRSAIVGGGKQTLRANAVAAKPEIPVANVLGR
jgi:hypothetical protein